MTLSCRKTRFEPTRLVLHLWWPSTKQTFQFSPLNITTTGQVESKLQNCVCVQRRMHEGSFPPVAADALRLRDACRGLLRRSSHDWHANDRDWAETGKTSANGLAVYDRVRRNLSQEFMRLRRLTELKTRLH